MNPVLSDLSIRVALVEAEARVDAMRRYHLAREASPSTAAFATISSQVEIVVNAVRQFVDPRGWAMRQLQVREALAMPEFRPEPEPKPVPAATPGVVEPPMATVTAMACSPSGNLEDKPAA
ncbi:MAG: hypothetical protein M3457_12920 [Chloroflexota bacterium]|nr:hypothetical protein [Chloroflexota bacterium]